MQDLKWDLKWDSLATSLQTIWLLYSCSIFWKYGRNALCSIGHAQLCLVCSLLCYTGIHCRPTKPLTMQFYCLLPLTSQSLWATVCHGRKLQGGKLDCGTSQYFVHLILIRRISWYHDIWKQEYLSLHESLRLDRTKARMLYHNTGNMSEIGASCRL